MVKRTLGSLGTMVRKKRGEAKLRETAKAIGIGPATLLRVESGRTPDVLTFGKICRWLGEDPGSFLGFEDEKKADTKENPLLLVSAHFKADKTQQQKTANALAQMILFAVKSQHATEEIPEDGNI